ncbi:MAG: RES domain-containing protein [Candidatus Dormibacteria bacterium]
MTTLFRHVDPRFPFLWEDADQPPARWHEGGEGPVQYLADTPDGAWAEFLRHEEITEADDLAGIERDLWAVELERLPATRPRLARTVLTGGVASYPACRTEARRLRSGADGLVAPSAALRRGRAGGQRVSRGALLAAPARDGRVVVLFGRRPDLAGWRCCRRGRPGADLLGRVNHY